MDIIIIFPTTMYLGLHSFIINSIFFSDASDHLQACLSPLLIY